MRRPHRPPTTHTRHGDESHRGSRRPRLALALAMQNRDGANMEQAKDLGILHYMAKPFDLFELRDRVGKILINAAI